MKKIGYFAIIVCAILVLSACSGGKKVLECKQSNGGVSVVFTLGYKGKRLSSMTIKYDMDVSSDEYKDSDREALSKQDFCTAIKESMPDFKKGINKCEHNIVDKHIKIDAEVEVDKIERATLDRMTDIQTAKEGLEAEGNTCTIK